MDIIILFSILGISLIIGIPIGFSIAITVLGFLFVIDFPQLGIVAQQFVAGVDSFTLLALPFFILAGDLMAFGTTQRLMRIMNAFLGHIKGGLAISGVGASAFFGAISGSGVATSAAVGTLYEPEMVKKGYKKGFVASIIAGAGALGIVIPPSLAMVVFGVASGTSIGQLLIAGLIPGIFVSVLLMLYSYWYSKKYNFPSEPRVDMKERFRALKDGILPLFIPIIILGGVMSGLFTPTESAVIAVVFALFLGVVVYKELKLRDLPKVVARSMRNSAMISFIIAASTPLGWVMEMERIPRTITESLIGIASGDWMLILFVLVIILVLGTFMEGIAIIVIMTPIFMPVILEAGMDPVHFGVLFMVALAIGGATPPLAVNLFVTTKIIGIKVEDTFPSILQIVFVMIVGLGILTLFPQLSLFLPSLSG